MKRLVNYLHFLRMGFSHGDAWKYSKPMQYRRFLHMRNAYNSLFELLTAVMVWILCACGVLLCVTATYVLLRRL